MESDSDPNCLRISIDSKAKVDIGDFSRNGKSRTRRAKKALDHDMNVEKKLVPFGILEVLTGSFTIIFGSSYETSDFIVDALEKWYLSKKTEIEHVKTLAINLDNGPQASSNRTQFLKRITEFSTKYQINIRLVYYPPYHSKYNPIERCWSSLERYWNGEILDSVDKAINWASNMKWKGMKPLVEIIDKEYQKGISVSKKLMRNILMNVEKSKNLPKWDLLITPSG